MEQLVIIPFGYEQLPDQEQNQLVPICIPRIDPRGFPIPMEWFEKGVAPVHAYLVRTARWRLRDPWRASELAEATIFNLFRRHGDDTGSHPARRVVREAAWVAKDLAAGGRRAERNQRLRQRSISGSEHRLVDPADRPGLYQRELFLETVEARLGRKGPAEMVETLALVRLGHDWPEIARRLGFPSQRALRQRFYRWLRSEPECFAPGARAGLLASASGDADPELLGVIPESGGTL